VKEDRGCNDGAQDHSTELSATNPVSDFNGESLGAGEIGRPGAAISILSASPDRRVNIHIGAPARWNHATGEESRSDGCRAQMSRRTQLGI
jgi:hypothetical protein